MNSQTMQPAKHHISSPRVSTQNTFNISTNVYTVFAISGDWLLRSFIG